MNWHIQITNYAKVVDHWFVCIDCGLATDLHLDLVVTVVIPLSRFANILEAQLG